MSGRSERRSRTAAAITFCVFGFLFTPLVIVVLFSFQGSSSLTFPLSHLGFSWYSKVLGDAAFRSAFLHSAVIGAAIAITNLLVGTAAAWGVTRSRWRVRAGVGALLTAAITLPGLFIGVMLLSLFDAAGVSNSLFTVACAHFVWTFPLFFLIARTTVDRLDRDLEDAAADLGARPWQSFRRVTWPQIATLMIGAAALTFALSFDEFIATSFVVGSQQTVPTLVYGKLRIILDPSINVIATILMLLLVTITVVVFAVVLMSDRRKHSLRTMVERPAQ